MEKAKKDAQTWEALLSVTGGELELSKCFYYVLSWKWDKFGIPKAETKNEQKLAPIILKMTTTRESKEIQQKEVFESHKTLGTFKCLVGKEQTQYEKLLSKSNSMAELVNVAQFTHHQAWLAYSCCYIPTMVYSLTAVNLNEKQLTEIQRKATTYYTRATGFERTFPKAVVHGPVSFGGLGFQHLYVESNIGKLETLICHINKKTSLGTTMVTNLNWVQMHAGVKTPVLEYNKKLDYVENNWFDEIRIFLYKCQAKVIVKSAWVPKLL
jgi:hypothetical protein